MAATTHHQLEAGEEIVENVDVDVDVDDFQAIEKLAELGVGQGVAPPCSCASCLRPCTLTC
jgi:hypothetical protein